MKKRVVTTILLSIITALFIMSTSIATPILCKPFYYAQIEALDIEEYSGFSEGQIKEAYNEVVDFCTGIRGEFSTGDLKWSESGKAHFEDCRVLFILDFVVMILSAIILIVFNVLMRKKRVFEAKVKGLGHRTFGSVGLVAVFAVVGGLAAIDFDKAFVIFHKIFFPGKDNWVFDYSEDEIIKILPETFFMNCAILALVMMLVLGIVFVSLDIYGKKKK